PPPHPYLPSFPTRRSSDLVVLAPSDQPAGQLQRRAAHADVADASLDAGEPDRERLAPAGEHVHDEQQAADDERGAREEQGGVHRDRKSTRLNSSHVSISYA